MSDEAVEAAELVAGESVPEAAKAPPGGEPDPLFDKMFDGIVEVAGVEEEKPAEEAKADEKKPEDEEDAEPEFDDLSDDRPWTPERIKNAAAVLRADRRKLGGMLHEVNRKTKSLKEKQAAIKQEKQQINLITTRVMTDLEALRVGSPQEAAAALGRLSQRDPHQVYEDMSLAFLGKAGQKKDPTVAALEAKLDAALQKLETRERSQTEEERTASDQREVIAVLNAEREWPIIASKAKDDPEGVAQEFWGLYQEHRRRGGKLDVESFADRIERRLRAQSIPSHQVKQNGAAGSGPDRVQETRAQANPDPAQSPPRSLSPSLSATDGGARRTPTEEERAAEFARSAPPEFFQQFGF